MVEKKYVVHNGETYSYFPCTRCLNGTMAWERDKNDVPPYLKCMLCGKEEPIRTKKSENSAKKPHKKPQNKAKIEVKVQVKPEIKA